MVRHTSDLESLFFWALKRLYRGIILRECRIGVLLKYNVGSLLSEIKKNLPCRRVTSVLQQNLFIPWM